MTQHTGALAQRRVLVTGGAAGIGLASARALAAQGAAVEIADVEPPPAPLSGHRTDVSVAADVARLWRTLAERSRLPDLLVINAGVGLYERLCEGDPEKWQRLFDINVLGALRIIRAFVPAFPEQGGDVVFIGSVAAGQPLPYGGPYSAAKAALECIAETLRLETQPRVRVITVSPGVVDTNFYTNLLAGERDVDSLGVGSVSADQIADSIVYALTRPHDVAINRITIRPREQAY